MTMSSTGYRVIVFQSTPSRGGRLQALNQQQAQEQFQSTPSRGGRHAAPPSS